MLSRSSTFTFVYSTIGGADLDGEALLSGTGTSDVAGVGTAAVSVAGSGGNSGVAATAATAIRPAATKHTTSFNITQTPLGSSSPRRASSSHLAPTERSGSTAHGSVMPAPSM